MERDDVSFSQKPIERDEFDAVVTRVVAVWRNVVGDYSHRKSLAAPRHGPPDAAETNDAHRPPPQSRMETTTPAALDDEIVMG